MKYAVDSKQMKEIDSYTIEGIKIPSMVLMERAAIAVTEQIVKGSSKKDKIIAVCGNGNNGGDGVAIARMLFEKGYKIDIFLVSDRNNATKQLEEQLIIAENIGISILNNIDFSEYNIIIDAILGIGLSRLVSGSYKKIIDDINESDAKVFSIDIPSGINANDGKIMGIAVKADKTVTFGVNKLGLILYPGCEYAGKTVVKDIGFPKKALEVVKNKAIYYTNKDLIKIPQRRKDGNKGSFGKILIVAGSKNMSGACYLSAKAAYRMGAGLVKILTIKDNKEVLKTLIPEAIFSFYEEEKLEELKQMIVKELKWADSVVIGPGIGDSIEAKILLEEVLARTKVPVVLDADGLNIFSKTEELELNENVIITPHLKEMSRILKNEVSEIKENLIDIAKNYAKDKNVTVVLKDARTIIADRVNICVNKSGNNGMATAGSGDVLTGIIAALTAIGLTNFDAASLGVYIHGLVGDEAVKKKGEYSLMAGDLIETIPKILRR